MWNGHGGTSPQERGKKTHKLHLLSLLKALLCFLESRGRPMFPFLLGHLLSSTTLFSFPGRQRREAPAVCGKEWWPRQAPIVSAATTQPADVSPSEKTLGNNDRKDGFWRLHRQLTLGFP